MAIHIGRRGFIVALGGTMAALPLAARAQQAEPMRRIGVLIEFDETDPEAKAYPSGLTRGLAQLGWTHGRNVRIDIRWPHLGASREVGSWHCQIPMAVHRAAIISLAIGNKVPAVGFLPPPK